MAAFPWPAVATEASLEGTLGQHHRVPNSALWLARKSLLLVGAAPTLFIILNCVQHFWETEEISCKERSSPGSCSEARAPWSDPTAGGWDAGQGAGMAAPLPRVPTAPGTRTAEKQVTPFLRDLLGSNQQPPEPGVR